MKNKNPELSLVPQNINEKTWYYEDTKNIDFITYEKPGDGGAIYIKIPWSKLIKSVERYKAVKKSKTKAKP